MAYKTCPDCGSRMFEYGCVNCNESEYISMQEGYESSPSSEHSPKAHEVKDMGNGWHHCMDCNYAFKTPEIRKYVGTSIEDLKSYHEELNSLKEHSGEVDQAAKDWAINFGYKETDEFQYEIKTAFIAGASWDAGKKDAAEGKK